MSKKARQAKEKKVLEYLVSEREGEDIRRGSEGINSTWVSLVVNECGDG
jgi:hypothetical protein